MAMAMVSAVLAFFDGGVAMDVCFDVVGCVRLRVCLRVPAFVVVVEDVVDVDNVDGVVAEKFAVCDTLWLIPFTFRWLMCPEQLVTDVATTGLPSSGLNR